MNTSNPSDTQPAQAVSPITFSPENEAKAVQWLKTRGGIAVWSCKDLGSASLGDQTFTPFLTENGNHTTSPNWRCGNGAPDRVVTDPACVIVQTYREVSRVKIRRGPPCYGCVNRADRAKLDRALDAAGDGAGWVADYSAMEYGSAWFEAVISVPDSVRPLAYV